MLCIVPLFIVRIIELACIHFDDCYITSINAIALRQMSQAAIVFML